MGLLVGREAHKEHERGPLHIPAPFFPHPLKKRESFKRAPVELPFIGFFSYVKLPTGSFIR